MSTGAALLAGRGRRTQYRPRARVSDARALVCAWSYHAHVHVQRAVLTCMRTQPRVRVHAVCSPAKNRRQSAGRGTGGSRHATGQLNERTSPRPRPSPAGASKEVTKLNPSTAKLLEDVFLAYCGANSGTHVKSVSLDSSGWHAFCSECRLVEGKTSHELLRDLFNRAASGGGRADRSTGNGRLHFEAFVSALTAVAEAKYGATDSIARLVYFKIVRFGRTAAASAAERAASPRAASPPSARTPRGASSGKAPAASRHTASASPREQGRGRQTTRSADAKSGRRGLAKQSGRSPSNSSASSSASSPSPHTRRSRAAAKASSPTAVSPKHASGGTSAQTWTSASPGKGRASPYARGGGGGRKAGEGDERAETAHVEAVKRSIEMQLAQADATVLSQLSQRWSNRQNCSRVSASIVMMMMMMMMMIIVTAAAAAAAATAKYNYNVILHICKLTSCKGDGARALTACSV